MQNMKTVCVKKEADTNENYEPKKQINTAVNHKKEKNKYLVEQETEIHINIGDIEKKTVKQECVSGNEQRKSDDRTAKRKIDGRSFCENSDSDDCADNEDKIGNRKRKYDTDEDYFPSDDSRNSTSSASNEDEIDSTTDCTKNDSDEDLLLAITENLSKINRKRKYESDSVISEETTAELPLSCKFIQKMNNKYLDQYIQNILCEKEQATEVDDETVHGENLKQLDEPCEESRTSETVQESSLQEESIERGDPVQTVAKNIDPCIKREWMKNNGQQMLFENTTQLDDKKGNVKVCRIIKEEPEKESVDNECIKNKLSINTLCMADKISKNYMYLKASKKFTNKKSSLDDYMENILTENARNCELAKINEPKNKTLNDYIENILMENAGSITEDRIIVPEHDESLKLRKITVKVEKSSNENENDELEEEKENSDFASPSSPTEFAEHALQITEKVKKKRLCLDDYIENILFENANTVGSNVIGPTGEWIESFSDENTMSKNVNDSLDENHPEEEMQKIYSKLENVENFKLENGDPESEKIKQKTAHLFDNVTNEWWTDVYPNIICAENTLQENISITIASEDIGMEKIVKSVQVKLEKTSDYTEVVITENLNNNELFDEKLKEKESHLEDVLPEKVEEFRLNEDSRDPLYLNEFVETTLQENSKSESSSEDGKQTQCTKFEKSYKDFLLSDSSKSNDLTEISGRKEFDKKTSLHAYMENILSENTRNDENIDTTGLLPDLDASCEKQNIGNNYILKTGIKLEKSPGDFEMVLLQEKLDINNYIGKATENARSQLSNKSCKNMSEFNAEENSRIGGMPVDRKISLEDSFPQRCYSCRTTFKNSSGLKEHIRTFHYNRKPSQKLGTHTVVKLKNTT